MVQLGDRVRYKRGDTAPDFRARCLRTADSGELQPADLTGATARMLLRTTVQRVPLLLPFTLTVEADGWVRRVWAAGDLAVVASYDGEVEVTYSNGKIQTFPGAGYFTLEVLPDLG